MDLLIGLALSTHLSLAGDYNEIHPHVRLENEYIATGMYYNSIGNTSLYFGLHESLTDKISVEGGVVSGYDSFGSVIPYARIVYEVNDEVDMFITPTAEKRRNTINTGVVIGFEFMFDK
jgi:hypothetical protein